ncbi:MAG: dephospho-CoA kinase [Tissierellia bacterium]|nr:dephospho-CoA kinase [Tissierellia bacterium]
MTQNKKYIGLTGGIASGKSAASGILRSLGQEVIDADQLARQVVLPKSPGLRQVENHFGPHIIQPTGQLDRERLAQIIFKDEEARKALNQILHPLIFEEMLAQAKKTKSPLVFFDSPLLYELYEDHLRAGLHFDDIWLVYVPRDLQVRRLQERDQIPLSYAQEKINAQMDLEEKKKRAGLVLDNQGDLKDLADQIQRALKKLRKGA